MSDHFLTGFGFGPIQAGLFGAEAFASGNFSRIVVAEIDRDFVKAVRANHGTYYVNVAGESGVEALRIDGVELLDPADTSDRTILIDALGQSTEIVTALPSVSFYDAGDNSIASLISKGLARDGAGATIIYAAENNNHAAEILEGKVAAHACRGVDRFVQYLNTVIGKMSQVISDPAEIAQRKLKSIASGIERAFLVEQFNRILVTKCRLRDLRPGIEVFVEKDDLIPFEEAKLYGHNAVHALLAYLGALKGYRMMSELKEDRRLIDIAKAAFLNESGAALTRKYADLNDALFTEQGYREYAEDLLARMTNPFLGDTVSRAGRDPLRKLAYDDRIFGTMRLALEYGIEPVNMALGAAAAIDLLLRQAEQYGLPEDLRFSSWRELEANQIEKIIRWTWGDSTGPYAVRLVRLTQNALARLRTLVGRNG